MEKAIEDLVSMNDAESLLEIMEDHEDEFIQLDAAEGLVKLGHKRGLEFLTTAMESDDKEIRDYARELLDSQDVRRMKEQMAADEQKKHQARLLSGKKRLQDGKKVYIYKIVPITTGDLIDRDARGQEFDVPALDDAGMEGWEAVNLLPPAGGWTAVDKDTSFIGAYVLMKKELSSDDDFPSQVK